MATRLRLTGRIVLASAVVMLLAIGAYAVLFAVIFDLRSSSRVTRRSEAMLTGANRVERLVTDLAMGARGYILTGEERSLRPWEEARAELPRDAERLVRLAAATDPAQVVRARQVQRDIHSFIVEYSVPLVTAARRDPNTTNAAPAIVEGERRLRVMRGRLEQIKGVQREIADAHDDRADRDARRATLIAAAGAVGALSLILAFSGYLNRAVLRPVRRTSGMAGVVAGGDLGVRTPETSRHEVGRLEQVFNAMASSLQSSQNDLRRFTDEQRSLRLIATLVARRMSPGEIFTAVARELGQVQQADYTVINRFEPGRFVTTVGHWTAPGVPAILPPLNGHWPLEDETAIGQVYLTGLPTRSSYLDADGAMGSWTREHGIHHAVAAPIMAGGRLWGSIVITSLGWEDPPADTEARLLGFVELLATTIANAENRNELLASSARIVRAAEAACARIEGDLGDVTERRLTSLQSGLRAIQESVPAEQAALSERLAGTARGLHGVLDDLQEISRGVRPPSGGLRSDLQALAQRSGIPTDLDVRVDRRLSAHVEQTIYYTVCEALANVAKHARASRVSIDLAGQATALRLRVNDDGVGGADPSHGSGLTGLRERVEGCGGTIEITSPAGRGTSLVVVIPAPGT